VRTLDDLTPREFEHLTYDLAAKAGLRSLVWRTPGSDSGRDIEGVSDTVDWTGAASTAKWYVECKKYSSSISWPVIWTKLAHADAHQADFLLLSTNSNPSPPCETEISNWNRRGRKPQIRVWRSYEFDQMIRRYPAIGQKYGLLPAVGIISSEKLTLLLRNIAQSNESALYFGSDPQAGVSAAASISELISMREAQLRDAQKFLRSEDMTIPPEWNWLKVEPASLPIPDEAGIRAMISYCRYVYRPLSINVKKIGQHVTLYFNNSRIESSKSVESVLIELANWTDYEVYQVASNKSVTLSGRGFCERDTDQ